MARIMEVDQLLRWRLPVLLFGAALLVVGAAGVTGTPLKIDYRESVAITMGLWGWVGAILTGPSASAPIIILTIAVADCVYLLASFFLFYLKGHDKRTAIKRSLQFNAKPVIITSVTTAIGFLSMNFSDVPPFNILGNAVAVGVLIACAGSLVLKVGC